MVCCTNYALADGENYDSTHNVEPKAALTITILFIVFCLYVAFRVYQELRKEK